MGITGLIPFLEKASAKVHLKDLSGSTVAVDTYCWLHKGVFSCADKLARGEDTDLYVQYCLKYVHMLLSYNIKPILVFDGQHLPAKALTEQRRRESRQQSKKRAMELLRLGRTDEARSQMRRCVDVTHEMALRLIQECRVRHIDCIVAPYEADAQMAWLNKAGIAQYIVTEDSDLTLFGAQRIIFKLDLNGAGLLVEAEKFHLAMGCTKERYRFDKFRRMCILSGCDYLDSLPGIGLAKACKFMLKTEQDDMRIALKKIPQYLNMRNLEVDDDYIENFMKAEATFKHMYIYNPLERRMERLSALEDHETEEGHCSNAGSLLADNEKALHLALGNLNPFTLKSLDNWHPDKATDSKTASAKHIKRTKHKSIWQAHSNNTHEVELTTQPKPTSCALFFKKVDFVGQTIQSEIEANQRQEQAKHTEAELFSLYSFKAKRKRSPSRSGSNSTPPPSPVQSKSRHNPFAIETTQHPPAVCENASLLRLVSPLRSAEEPARPEAKRVNALKRSIFAKEQPQVEVRSRFFSAQAPEPHSEPKVVAEKKAQPELELESTTSATAVNDANNNNHNDDDIVLLASSGSDEDTSSQSATLPSSQEAALPAKPQLKLATSARRVGLSKPRTKKTKTKSALLGDNQTKLSAFGFQKRSVLK
ncbi:exonuclease 1 [Drosophila novamexicana]|uniref:exonuclease 1 n=1 Tax=Drosophila novamexicana TaxID=47314 RepID=UPI0011E5C6A2|nr:exonuclease 1 [Drosophila novamexicana]